MTKFIVISIVVIVILIVKRYYIDNFDTDYVDDQTVAKCQHMIGTLL